MIKLKSLINELTPDQKDRKKDYLFGKLKASTPNTVPSWSEIWKNFTTNTDSFDRAFKDMKLMLGGEFEDVDDKAIMAAIEKEQLQKYHRIVEEYKELEGATCWRMITIPPNVDPTKIAQLGVYWATEEGAAEAHWGHKPGRHMEVTYDGIIDLHNMDWYGTMFARMDYVLGDDEKEIRFIKNSRIFITRCHTLYHGRVDRHIINDWRRT